MFALSYVWHGIALKDLEELRIPLTLYTVLAGMVYLVIGFGLTIAVHKGIEYEFISLKGPFPLTSFGIGAVAGFIVYLMIFVLGLSFADRGLMHILADSLWQMFEQGLGGLMVSLGIIYDLHQRFLEQERSH